MKRPLLLRVTAILLLGLVSLFTTTPLLLGQDVPDKALVIYSHDANQQVTKRYFTISEVDSILFVSKTLKQPITFEVSDVIATSSSLSISVVPSDDTTTYYIGVDNKEHYDQHFTSDKAYLDNKLKVLNAMAGAHGQTLSEYLQTILKRGAATHKEDDLYSDTEYYICIFGLSTSGEVTSPLYKQEVKTLPFTPTGDTTFELQLTAQTASSLTVQVTPSDVSTNYFYGILTKEQYATYKSPEEAVSDLIFNAELTTDVDWSDPQNTLRGAQTITLSNLKSETEYVLLVFGISAEGEQTTTAAILQAKTSGDALFLESPIPFGSKYEAIAAYEASKGSMLDSDLSGSQGMEYMYVYRVQEAPSLMRIYFVSQDGAGELNEYWAVEDRYSSVFEMMDGQLILSKSFVATLTQAGYTAPVLGEGSNYLSSKGDQYDLMIMPTKGGDLGISQEKIVVLDFAPRGELLPKSTGFLALQRINSRSRDRRLPDN